MRRLLAVIAIASLSAGAIAHFPQPSIDVEGFGSVEAIPDSATLNLHVEREGESEAALRREVDAVIEQVTHVLREFGIPEEDFGLSKGSSMTPKPVNGQTRADVGPSKAFRYVKVTIRDLGELSELISQATEAGVSHIGSVDFKLSDAQSEERAAIEQAIGNAKAQAEAATAVLETTIGPVLSTSVNVDHRNANQARFGDSRRTNRTGGSAELHSPKPVTIMATVRMTFSLIEP